jgi:hypothetical protein
VYQDGKAPRKLAIISFPKRMHPSITSRWYVLRCETHDSWWWKGDVLRTARAHLLNKCHLGGQTASFQQTIDAFGLRVLDCTSPKAKLNFEACEKQRILEREINGLSKNLGSGNMGRTQTSSKARSPTLMRKPSVLPPARVGSRRSARGGTSILGEPVIGEIYLIWSDISKAFYAGTRVPANISENGYLRPFCGLYFDRQCKLDAADSDENRADDETDEFKDRQYLVMWLDDRMELPPHADYVLPDDIDALDWVAVKDFRSFDLDDELSKEYNGYRTAQVFAQRMKWMEERQVSPSPLPSILLDDGNRRATTPKGKSPSMTISAPLCIWLTSSVWQCSVSPLSTALLSRRSPHLDRMPQCRAMRRDNMTMNLALRYLHLGLQRTLYLLAVLLSCSMIPQEVVRSLTSFQANMMEPNLEQWRRCRQTRMKRTSWNNNRIPAGRNIVEIGHSSHTRHHRCVLP